MLTFIPFLFDICIVIHPESRFRKYWDYSVLVVTLFGVLETPFSIVFGFTSLVVPRVFNWAIPLVFLADMIVQFQTARRVQGKLVMDRDVVARGYLRGWFWIDLLAALPVGYLLFAISVPAGSAFYLLSLNPLFKLPRGAVTLRKAGGTNINPAIHRLLLLVFWILMAAHLVSCAWIFILGNNDSLDPLSQYIQSFYWTVTTLTTIGYGDITPDGNVQVVFVIFIELLGAGMYGLVIGNIANLIANIDVAKTQYKEKIDKINTFLKYRNIPVPMQKKINDYYGYLWESRRGYDESSVLEDLPDPLKVSVSLFLNKGIIEQVPIFADASEDLIKDIIMNLTPVVFTPGDYIVKGGEVGFDMFFISKGTVDVTSLDEKTHYATLSAGQFFGEIALLLSTSRTATIKAREYCDLYRLEKESFDRVLIRYPDFAKTIGDLAEGRRAEIEATAGKKTEAPAVVEPKDEVPGKVEVDRTAWKGEDVTLLWMKTEGALFYEVVQYFPSAAKWQFIERKAFGLSFSFKPDTTARVLAFRIRGVNTVGPGEWSAVAKVRRTL